MKKNAEDDVLLIKEYIDTKKEFDALHNKIVVMMINKKRYSKAIKAIKEESAKEKRENEAFKQKLLKQININIEM